MQNENNQTWQNKLYTGDNLYILHGMNSESVDLIYLDPPFNSKRLYSAPVGSKAAGSSFKDMWTWEDVDEYYLEKLAEEHTGLVHFIESIEQTHSKAMMAYITYMTERIIEMHRILKEDGSFYFHCDPTASHYVKIMLDEIFGRSNFRNEIVWCYSGPSNSKMKRFPGKHDIIFAYAKDIDKHYFNGEDVRIPYKSLHSDKGKKSKIWGSDGVLQNEETRQEYLDRGKLPFDWWSDIPSGGHISPKERTGYPTQKPLALLERIIKASCPKGGVVLDPFCGCATTCVAAENLNRKWIGIDIAEQSVELVMDRLKDAEGHLFTKFINLNKPPKRTDIIEEPITNETKNSIKERLFKQQNGHCNGCNIELEIRLFEIDHVIPKARGGGDYFENYQLLCGHCNKSKGDKPMDYLRMKIEERKKLMKNKIRFGG